MTGSASLPDRKIVTGKSGLGWDELSWFAHFADDVELGGYGYGATEQQAIDDLLEDE